MDFNFAQMFSENRFSGSDRINDANQITFALASRLLESGTGKERLRLAVGQQYSFIDRGVTLDAPETISRRPDFVAADDGISYPDHHHRQQPASRSRAIHGGGRSARPELSAGAGRVINVGYRFTRDVSAPGGRFQPVALVRKLANRRAPELLHCRIREFWKDWRALEYNACCWSLRFVLQHLTTATQKTTTAAFLQLELNGLMQIGSNPLHVLQRSIPGYAQNRQSGSSSIEGPQSREHKILIAFIPLQFSAHAYSHGQKILVSVLLSCWPR